MFDPGSPQAIWWTQPKRAWSGHGGHWVGPILTHFRYFLASIDAFLTVLSIYTPITGDLFNDLEKEWSEYSKRRGREAAGPKSLWEELADIGEELVEFLEKVRENLPESYALCSQNLM